ncbi:hypothetical protein SAMN05519104_2363 [Rhizobiales bacterium GAS188]|nr:hypothetical protein SAMN05519104_2363 [Rhizobiales bacterium GAS188]
MKKYEGRTFAATGAWSGPEIAMIGETTVKLRWTDEPYRWHINDGQEVFAVIDGIVDMHVRERGRESVITLLAGDVLHVGAGEEHVAHPRGSARILVIEQVGSA